MSNCLECGDDKFDEYSSGNLVCTNCMTIKPPDKYMVHLTDPDYRKPNWVLCKQHLDKMMAESKELQAFPVKVLYAVHDSCDCEHVGCTACPYCGEGQEDCVCEPEPVCGACKGSGSTWEGRDCPYCDGTGLAIGEVQ
jgi:hypothetical protein